MNGLKLGKCPNVMSVSVLVHNVKVSKRLEAVVFLTFDRITQSLDITYLYTK